MRLGCMSGGSTVSSGTPRFNEAEAHAPRMPGGDQPGADDIAPRFNEAEAHAPRMLRPIVYGRVRLAPLQ